LIDCVHIHIMECAAAITAFSEGFVCLVGVKIQRHLAEELFLWSG
jgi:hypothetical protein